MSLPPSPGTSFVGREEELVALEQAVRAERLITLHGPGGAGKTRLALELAKRVEGAVFADLGALATGASLWPPLAQLAGVRDEPGAELAGGVVRALAPRELLLVLDNCEHVLAGAREAAPRLLDGCPALTLLATSREPLDLAAETVWPVPPLTDDDAGRLFEDRAIRVLPGFAVRDEQALTRVCRRLDGIPLAIELAAARVKVMEPAEIAERLDDRFRLLAREDPSRPPRQRTLRALVDWSYELLEPGERALLARLSVFAGGFELDAAEHVCGDDVVDVLADLVDKALVARGERGGRARFRLHETIREYARERLAEHGETEVLAQRHLGWCLELATIADDAWMVSGGATWLDRMQAEQENLRQALRWGLESGHAEQAFGVAWRFANFVSYWGRADEAAEWLERTLEATAGSPPSVDRARALTRAGEMARFRGRLREARAYYEAARAIGVDIDDPVRVGVSLLALSDVDRAQGHLAAARRCAEDGLAAIRRSGDRERARWLVEALAAVDLAEGDARAARTGFLASREEAVALGNEIGLAATTRLLGEAEREAGDRVAARMRIEEALALARRNDDRETEAGALLSLGRLELDAGADASAPLTAALRLADATDARPLAIGCLEALAQARAHAGDPAGGARLLGAAAALRETLGTPPEPREAPWLAELESELERALGGDVLAGAVGAGRGRAWPDTLADALEPAAPAASAIDVELRREGETWALARPGHDVHLRDSKGLRYLAAVVAAAPAGVHVLELAGTPVDEPGHELIDETARAAYRRRLAELEHELDEADRLGDRPRAVRADDERHALLGELSAAVGLGGRPRRSGSSVERARKAVTNRIRTSLERIEREDPELGAHLRGSLRLGTECAYRPEPRSPWSLHVA